MPVGGDMLLLPIRAAGLETPLSPQAMSVDERAWQRDRRCSITICDLERGRVIDLLPERSGETVAAWVCLHPGIEAVACDCGALVVESCHADGAAGLAAQPRSRPD